jgi:hypothetical protein
MRCIRHGLAFTIVLVSVVFAQTVPEIAIGTAQEEVLHTHGSPKGRSSAGPRESWLYEDFQIVFDHGRVLRVVPLDETRRADIQPGFSARIEPGPLAAPPSVEPASSPVARPPVPVVVRPIVVKPPSEPKRVNGLSPAFWLKALGVLLVVVAVVSVIRRRVLARRRQ